MAQWQIDPYHTQIEFSAKHLGMMTVRGNFTDLSAVGDIYPDDSKRSKIQVTIQMGSIQTHNKVRDDDLRSSNFLDVETYPTATFTTTAIEPTGTDEFSVTGDLTIKGVTQPVTLAMARLGEFSDPAMGHRIGYSGSTKIKRKDFGMSFNPILDGKYVVSDEIAIAIEGELVEQADAETAHAG